MLALSQGKGNLKVSSTFANNKKNNINDKNNKNENKNNKTPERESRRGNIPASITPAIMTEPSFQNIYHISFMSLNGKEKKSRRKKLYVLYGTERA